MPHQPLAFTLSWHMGSGLVNQVPPVSFGASISKLPISELLFWSGRACPRRFLLRVQSTVLLQVNRLAGLAVMLHCILPSALGLPPLLTTPSVTRALPAQLELALATQNALAVIHGRGL